MQTHLVMSPHAGLMGKTFQTRRALERFCTGVRVHMPHVVGFLLELPVADFALVFHLSSVKHEVASESSFAGKLFPADRTTDGAVTYLE